MSTSIINSNDYTKYLTDLETQRMNGESIEVLNSLIETLNKTIELDALNYIANKSSREQLNILISIPTFPQFALLNNSGENITIKAEKRVTAPMLYAYIKSLQSKLNKNAKKSKTKAPTYPLPLNARESKLFDCFGKNLLKEELSTVDTKLIEVIEESTDLKLGHFKKQGSDAMKAQMQTLYDILANKEKAVKPIEVSVNKVRKNYIAYRDINSKGEIQNKHIEKSLATLLDLVITQYIISEQKIAETVQSRHLKKVEK